jgi:glycosyltransferase involved in cell wall biosynthesis
MTVTVNFTSIPSRFDKLQAVIDNLKTHEIIDEIYIHIPKIYTVKHFENNVPLNVQGAIVNYVDDDHGPCRRYTHAKGDDIIIIVDDDTWYHPDISKELVKRHRETGHIWGGSGFNFKKYFLGDYSKTNGEEVQVLEGFGMIVLNRKIIDTIHEDILKYYQYFNTSDDILLNNLYEKYKFQRFYYCEPHWVKQLDYGFHEDALHKQNNGSHHTMYKKSLLKLREMNQMFFKPIVTYAITVCNEATELRNLLEMLMDTIVHADEIVVLVDSSKVTQDVYTVLRQFTIIRYDTQYFDGNFAKHKNKLNDMAKGEFIFQIDADEVPTGTLIEKLYILTHADLVYIPRVNIMLGMTESDIKIHGFSLNESGFINFPDLQGRFYKKKLVWSGAVHERITGAQRISQLPPDPKISLWHVKTARKSMMQRNFYENMSKNVR